MSCWSFGRVPRHIVYTKNYNILQNFFFFNIHSVFCTYSACSILSMLYIFAAKVLAFILCLLYLFIIFGYCQISCIWHRNLPCHLNKTFKSSKAKTDHWLNSCMFVQAHQTCKFSVEAINKRSGSRKMLGQTREEEECTDARW